MAADFDATYQAQLVREATRLMRRAHRLRSGLKDRAARQATARRAVISQLEWLLYAAQENTPRQAR
jgi:hypothetical protein